MKAHLVGLARVLANAHDILLDLVFPRIWGFPGINICVYVFMVVAGYFYIYSSQ